MPLIPVTAVFTERMQLRPVVQSDLDDLYEINSDPAVTHFLPYATWQTAADGSAWLGRMRDLALTGSGQQLVLAHNATNTVIGSLLLFKYDESSARLELGYVLGRRHWRQGYMREAVAAICQHAFLAMSIRRIEAEVDPANIASNILLQGVGFTLEGTLRQRWVSKGAAYDTNIYGLLAADWQGSGNRV